MCVQCHFLRSGDFSHLFTIVFLAQGWHTVGTITHAAGLAYKIWKGSEH